MLSIDNENLLAAALFLVAAVAGVFVWRMAKAPGARTQGGGMAIFFSLFALEAATSRLQRTLSYGDQHALATAYLLVAIAYGVFVIWSAIRERRSRVPKK